MIKKLLILYLFFCLSSCQVKQIFSVVVWNKTGEKLKNVKVWDNDKIAYDMGSFVIDGRMTYSSMYTPLTENIKLTWTEYESGIEREVKVDMTGVIPEKYDGGTVQFDILSSDKVVVKFYIVPIVRYPSRPKN